MLAVFGVVLLLDTDCGRGLGSRLRLSTEGFLFTTFCVCIRSWISLWLWISLAGSKDVEDDAWPGSGVKLALERFVLKALMNLKAVGGRFGDPGAGDSAIG